jgi:hypothetical protein
VCGFSTDESAEVGRGFNSPSLAVGSSSFDYAVWIWDDAILDTCSENIRSSFWASCRRRIYEPNLPLNLAVFAKSK